jgi:uncharacterized protein YqgV (UPF0045/DUF77 family)
VRPDPTGSVTNVSHSRLEFFVEPFVSGQPGPHVRAAIAAVERCGLPVEFGAFGNVAEGTLEQIADACAALVRDAVAAGATRISVQVVSG